MGAAAKIEKLPLAVGRYGRFDKAVDELALVGVFGKSCPRLAFVFEFEPLRLVVLA